MSLEKQGNESEDALVQPGLDRRSPLLGPLLALGLLAASCSGPTDDPSPSGDGDGVGGTTQQTGGTTGDPGTGGSPEPGVCTGCDNGCCDGDTCIPFSAQAATQCGSDGFTCQACAFGEKCSGGSCETDITVCSALTCSTGCCLDGECITDTDWTACGKGGEACGQCAYGTECADGGFCTPYLHDDAIFTVSISSVELEQTNLGDSWDIGSAPDPFVCVTNGVDEACTDAECTDSLTCTFPLSHSLDLTFTGAQLKNDGIEFIVWNDDGIGHDQAGSATAVVPQLEEDYLLEGFDAVASLVFTLE